MVSIINREDISNLDSKEYDANSIKHLDTREAMRSRIQMYLGTSDDDGVYQSFKEIVNNATDEILAGYGNSIEIMIDEDNNIATIRDYGRGVPFGIRDDGTNVLVSIFTEAHTGGKFDKSSYKNSSGLNGIGGTACNMSSEFFKVESIRDGINHCAYFEEGILKDYKEIKTSEKTGTRITFKPDKKVFIYMDNGFVYDRICEEIKNISYLNKGVKFILNNGKKEDVFYSENGIVDFINDKVKKPLMSKPIYAEASDGTDKVEIAFIWTKEVGKSYVIANSLNCPELGSPATGAKRTLTNTVRKLARNKELSTELIRKGLFYIVNCTVLEPSFANQTKSKITNPNLATLTSEAFKKGLEEFERIPEFSSIIEMMLKLEKAEHAAEKAREAVLNHTKEMLDLRKQKLAFIDKLKDARILGEDSILLCVEGDSAASMVAKSRDVNRFGLLALKGKLINCLSNTEEKYLANEEIKLLLYAMGIDINHYNSKKLRYGKIGICVDGDLDGSHISLLITSAIRKLCPQILEENRLCWLKAPLFTEKKGKEQYYYYSEEEKQKLYRGGEIISLKGLGSMSTKEMKESMFSDKQRLEVLEYSKEGVESLERLMGEDVEPRKEFIFNKIDFSKYTDF